MRTLIRLGIMTVLGLSLSVGAYAQSSSTDPAGKNAKGQGYVFFAPGGIIGDGHSVGIAHFGGGGEVLVYRGLGIGGELGYLAPWECMGDGMGLFSVNGSYHFRRNRKFTPFITGGYSLAFRNGHANLLNFGAGAHYWFSDSVGLRMEFRDHIQPQYINEHFLGGRIGLSFR